MKRNNFLTDLEQICSPSQIKFLNPENTEAFSDTLNIFKTMPVSYEGNETAYLHYFYGGCDWYITEKDCEPDQLQAFGYVNIGYGFEAGYISIVELLTMKLPEGGFIELDLFFTPQNVKPLIKGNKIYQS